MRDPGADSFYGELARRIFGAETANLLLLVNEIVDSLRRGYSYSFLERDAFEKLMLEDPPTAMKVYWSELLFRAHWGAASSLIRSHRWLHGIVHAYGQGNILAFAASCRGFLEAAGDSFYSLGYVPLTLAEHFSEITAVLLGKGRRVLYSTELENQLIHLTHATRPPKGEVLPESHVAQPLTTYLASLGAAGDGVFSWYQWLCDIAHPGTESIRAFSTAMERGNETVVQLDPGVERKSMTNACVRHSQAMAAAVEIGINTTLLTLRTLNAFPLDAVRTPAVEKVSMDHIVAWQKIRHQLQLRT